MIVLKSLAVFILAGLCEIGGGYLIWLWLKEKNKKACKQMCLQAFRCL